MIVVEKIAELRELLEMMNGGKSKIGFVPTMGALHAGHISLIKRAKKENQVAISSIFVNPAQFSDPKDLQQYPKTPAADESMLSEAGCDVLFSPSIAEMYPDNNIPEIDFGDLDKVMEGKYRPGHFNGVAAVVARFFKLIKPHTAYFGEKDFQQLVIIRELNKRLGSPVNIVGCETLREPDGLALSSRNIHLTPQERKAAGVIYSMLLWAAKQIKAESPDRVRIETIRRIEEAAGFRVQYLEFVDSETLQPITRWESGKPQRACIAVLTSSTRLIDNIEL